MPPPLAVTSEAIENDGIYLLDDGVIMWLIIGKNIPTDWLCALLEGVDCVLTEKDRPQIVRFLTVERGGVLAPIAENIEKVIQTLRKNNSSKQGKLIVF